MTDTRLSRSCRRWQMFGTAAAAVLLLAAGVLLGRLLWPTVSSADPVRASDPTAAPFTAGTATGVPSTFVSPVGPTSVKNGIPTGYAHSKQGVTAAAVNWLVMSTVPSGVIIGDRQSVLSAKADLAAKTFLDGEPAGSAMVIPYGLGTDKFANDAATVGVVYTQPDMNGLANPGLAKFEAVWEDGDWRLASASNKPVLDGEFDSAVERYGLPLVGYFMLFPTEK